MSASITTVGVPGKDHATLTVAPYKKAVLVTGDTLKVKDTLKSLGGSWNRGLGGWCFAGSKKAAVVEALKHGGKNTVTVVTDSSADATAEAGASSAAPAAAGMTADATASPSAVQAHPGAPTKAEVREWCRQRHGSEWYTVDKAARLQEAHAALSVLQPAPPPPATAPLAAAAPVPSVGASATLMVAPHKKAILVTGETVKVKDTLQSLGGSWNRQLNGWCFPGSKRGAVLSVLCHDATNRVTTGFEQAHAESVTLSHKRRPWKDAEGNIDMERYGRARLSGEYKRLRTSDPHPSDSDEDDYGPLSGLIG